MYEKDELAQVSTDVINERSLVPVANTQYQLQPVTSLVPDVKPTEVIMRAQEQAKALMDIVEQQELYHVIRNKKYLFVEAWQLLAAFNGLNIVVESTQRISKDDAEGWEAKAKIYNTDGRVVGAGEAECFDSESNWKNKDDYMLRSMAQTRAVSKACRTILSFVVVLAGYEPTPYEEMDGVFSKSAGLSLSKPLVTNEQLDVINSLSTSKTIEWIKKTFDITALAQLTQGQASSLIVRLNQAKQ